MRPSLLNKFEPQTKFDLPNNLRAFIARLPKVAQFDIAMTTGRQHLIDSCERMRAATNSVRTGLWMNQSVVMLGCLDLVCNYGHYGLFISFYDKLGHSLSRSSRMAVELRDQVSECRVLGTRVVHRRNLANQRERRRMQLINKGFEVLRSRLPIYELLNKFKCPESRARRCRLTKVDILKLSVYYIKHLTSALSDTNAKSEDAHSIKETETLKDKGKEAVKLRRSTRVKSIANIKSVKQRESIEKCRLSLRKKMSIIRSGEVCSVNYLLSCSRIEDDCHNDQRCDAKATYKTWVPDALIK